MSDARDPFPDWSYETTAVQTAIPRGLGETVGLPIHQAAAFQFATLEEAQSEFAQGNGLSYARLQNPTVRALEERISALEGGAATVALASGQAATLTAILSVCRAGDHVVSTASLFGGSAGLLNNVLPLRVGDIVRATVFPASIGVGRVAATGSIIMERLIDLLTLLVCLAIGTTALGASTLPDWLSAGALVLGMVGAAALFAIFLFSGLLSRAVGLFAAGRRSGSPLRKVAELGANFLLSFQQMSSPGVLTGVFALSMLAWLGEAGLFWAVLAGFGVPAGLLPALLVTAFVTLSTLLPSSPGYVGPFHLAAISALVLLGQDKDVATSFAVLAHLMLWIPTTLAGGIAMLLRPEIFRGVMAGRSTD